MKYCAVILVGVAAFVFSGCDSRTECEKAVEHIIKVASEDTSIPRADRNAMSNMSNRKEMIDQCEQSFRPAGGVDCVLKAKTLQDVDKCRAKMLQK
ncbi:MAG: hypothetical protein HOI23_00395 [Deltaproteobacteria bacterium]|jgi:hypothetical protein|nr:hypothetical protein [Deltaproteobacteria bacterium]MBT6434853.1 hypothetical protein [Deltaproteobacteria bacterium]MBT6488773.1 hypothetical protein [Deltaproteobacteria bacterium]